MTEKLKIAPKVFAEPTRNFWFCFVFLLLAVFAFHGKIIPYSNEFVYLLRLEKNFLPNDWTFSVPANEHWFFNSIFSFPAKFLSLEILGWLGRIAAWVLCLASLIKLGRHWEIPFWAIGVSIFLWLAFAQSIVGEEWIFGGFEAKTGAYVCLLFALHEFSKQKIILPSILLGLSFSFHPAVGLWAIFAVGLALLFERISLVSFLKIVALTFIFALPGLLPMLGEQMNAAANSSDDWRFLVLFRVPWHLDPFSFSKSGTISLFAMLAFNIRALWKNKSFALRFLLKFQIALGAFFLLGAALRLLELFPLLRFMPMRLFPVFTPLFFIFTAFYTIPRIRSKKHKIIVSVFVLLIIALQNPFQKGYRQMRETVQSRTDAPNDLQKTFVWIAENTPQDTVLIAPPHRRDLWYFSRRAAVASYTYPTYDRIPEWRVRIADLTGNAKLSSGDNASEEIEIAFNKLSAEQIIEIQKKYAATHLVSRAVYSYPIIFETETYKVYQLP